jgi:hypothetical protein
MKNEVKILDTGDLRLAVEKRLTVPEDDTDPYVAFHIIEDVDVAGKDIQEG